MFLGRRWAHRGMIFLACQNAGTSPRCAIRLFEVFSGTCLCKSMFESMHDVNGVSFFFFNTLISHSIHAGCVAALVMGEVKMFKLFICHHGFALYLVFLPRGNKHNQNENDILLILYMACVSGNFKSLTLMVFCTSFNSCLASWSCWSRCCSLSAV